MKLLTKLLLGAALAVGFAMQTNAQQSERLLNFRLSGFLQDRDSQGNDKAVPFRYTTKEVINEIGFFKGLDLSNGQLLVIDSVNDTNIATRIVVRKNGADVDVSELFQIDQGDEVHSSRFAGDVFKNATLYSIDFVQFQTLDTDTNGLSLQLQLFSRETQRAMLKRIGANQFNVVSSTLNLDGNGELQDQFGLIGPVKGAVTIGAPKFVASPVVVAAEQINRVMMEVQQEQAPQNGQILPPLPPTN